MAHFVSTTHWTHRGYGSNRRRPGGDRSNRSDRTHRRNWSNGSNRCNGSNGTDRRNWIHGSNRGNRSNRCGFGGDRTHRIHRTNRSNWTHREYRHDRTLLQKFGRDEFNPILQTLPYNL